MINITSLKLIFLNSFVFFIKKEIVWILINFEKAKIIFYDSNKVYIWMQKYIFIVKSVFSRSESLEKDKIDKIDNSNLK